MPDDVTDTLPTESARKARLRRWTGRFTRAALVLAAALLVVLGYNYVNPPPVPLSEQNVTDLINSTMTTATPPPALSAQVYQTILPSLVLITTEGSDAAGEPGSGLGTGVVVSDEAVILTALHVVAGADQIEVIFADGTHAAADILGVDPAHDIAVLVPSQPPELIVPAILGSVGRMRVGDEAYAVGHPLGLTGSMSAGVISGFDRSLPLNDAGDRLDGLIQFDAAVNPGNSGGPLLNRQGQVIGIVTALANPSDQGYFIGIGFAVPISTAVAAAGGPPY